MFRSAAILSVFVLSACAPSPRPIAIARSRSATVPARPAWVARAVIPTAAERPSATTVVSLGEGVSQVAARSGLPATAILAANGLDAGAVLSPGQQLRLPAGRVHIVAAGETGIAIARAYGVGWSRVVAANRLVPPYTIEIGDRLLLPTGAAVGALSIEERARTFRIDIDDLITGSEPARRASPRPPTRATVASPRPTPPMVPQPLPALAGGIPAFAWPVDGRVLSTFGAKPGGRFNDGVNLKTGAGSAVRASADGVVAYAGSAVAGFGNLLLIKHAGGWVSAYGHNEALLVARGARVRRGDVVARAGATGAVDEPQLHFELRRGRTPVNPASVLPARG